MRDDDDLRAYPFRTVIEDRLPVGAVKVLGSAYVYRGELIVTGEPADDEEWPDEETGHNCDRMGCATFSHVVLRVPIPAWQLGDFAATRQQPAVSSEALRERLLSLAADTRKAIQQASDAAAVNVDVDVLCDHADALATVAEQVGRCAWA